MNRLGLRTVSNAGRPSTWVVATAIPAVQTRMASGGGGGAPSARKGKKGGPIGDPRVRMIRYFLFHPAEHTPRPLKFGTMRALRHWTIHRAWQLFCAQQRAARGRELERQYNSIRAACEALKLVADDGGESSAEEDGGRLYRVALGKKDVGTFPIELRIPTDTPPKNGWNHGWKRA